MFVEGWGSFSPLTKSPLNSWREVKQEQLGPWSLWVSDLGPGQLSQHKKQTRPLRVSRQNVIKQFLFITRRCLSPLLKDLIHISSWVCWVCWVCSVLCLRFRGKMLRLRPVHYYSTGHPGPVWLWSPGSSILVWLWSKQPRWEVREVRLRLTETLGHPDLRHWTPSQCPAVHSRSRSRDAATCPVVLNS